MLISVCFRAQALCVSVLLLVAGNKADHRDFNALKSGSQRLRKAAETLIVGNVIITEPETSRTIERYDDVARNDAYYLQYGRLAGWTCFYPVEVYSSKYSVQMATNGCMFALFQMLMARAARTHAVSNISLFGK